MKEFRLLGTITFLLLALTHKVIGSDTASNNPNVVRNGFYKVLPKTKNDAYDFRRSKKGPLHPEYNLWSPQSGFSNNPYYPYTNPYNIDSHYSYPLPPLVNNRYLPFAPYSNIHTSPSYGYIRPPLNNFKPNWNSYPLFKTNSYPTFKDTKCPFLQNNNYKYSCAPSTYRPIINPNNNRILYNSHKTNNLNPVFKNNKITYPPKWNMKYPKVMHSPTNDNLHFKTVKNGNVFSTFKTNGFTYPPKNVNRYPLTRTIHSIPNGNHFQHTTFRNGNGHVAFKNNRYTHPTNNGYKYPYAPSTHTIVPITNNNKYDNKYALFKNNKYIPSVNANFKYSYAPPIQKPKPTFNNKNYLSSEVKAGNTLNSGRAFQNGRFINFKDVNNKYPYAPANAKTYSIPNNNYRYIAVKTGNSNSAFKYNRNPNLSTNNQKYPNSIQIPYFTNKANKYAYPTFKNNINPYRSFDDNSSSNKIKYSSNKDTTYPPSSTNNPIIVTDLVYTLPLTNDDTSINAFIKDDSLYLVANEDSIKQLNLELDSISTVSLLTY